MMIKVLVNGALGRMGSEVVKQVFAEKELELVAVSDIFSKPVTLPDGSTMTTYSDVVAAVKASKPDVMVDFTRPDVVMVTLRKVLPLGVHCVVGTTGFTPNGLAEVDQLALKHDTAVLVAPNFSLGAVIMIRLCAEAAKYFKQVEIIEKHHDNKLDAPSGTALLTAQKIAEVRSIMRQGHPNERETLRNVRGGDVEGMRIHSVRLPGFVASQEVIFGGQGETLRICNDPVSRECYMPGVVIGCQRILEKKGLVYGLDKLL